jgi:hypothetical protein
MLKGVGVSRRVLSYSGIGYVPLLDCGHRGGLPGCVYLAEVTIKRIVGVFAKSVI